MTIENIPSVLASVIIKEKQIKFIRTGNKSKVYTYDKTVYTEKSKKTKNYQN